MYPRAKDNSLSCGYKIANLSVVGLYFLCALSQSLWMVNAQLDQWPPAVYDTLQGLAIITWAAARITFFFIWIDRQFKKYIYTYKLHEICRTALDKNFQYPAWLFACFRGLLVLCIFAAFAGCILLLIFGSVSTFLILGGVSVLFDIFLTLMLMYLFQKKLHQVRKATKKKKKKRGEKKRRGKKKKNTQKKKKLIISHKVLSTTNTLSSGDHRVIKMLGKFTFLTTLSFLCNLVLAISTLVRLASENNNNPDPLFYFVVFMFVMCCSVNSIGKKMLLFVYLYTFFVSYFFIFWICLHCIFKK
ncbi:hypothetical protein RFI_14377 [Reticulomyxa filosa]|uniref:Uncharacterized protein n=1 Tax=Reticulomyxa filosa TaxID=46433 RepID=X6N946_RETFI|nr:hypothetical protein RFI_14377 [Reticulomyxa filosa]|eukprot:ETO22815.1 hypothetical protein RFI_14377 [Reticulomyxa filosa]